MILRAGRRLRLDLARSWTIGDSGSDLAAGRAAGTRTALVLTGYGRRTKESPAGRRADLAAATLAAVVNRILAADQAARGVPPEAPGRSDRRRVQRPASGRLSR
jgi:D-glycero-D-manno-heptose 1,7-bisphosphate phosphatase